MLSPMKVGDGRVQAHTFTTDSAVFSLAGLLGSAIAFHFEDINNDNALTVATGTWAIVDDGTAGHAEFTPSHTDLTTGVLSKPGMYSAYPVVTLSTGPVPMDSQTVQVIAQP